MNQYEQSPSALQPMEVVPLLAQQQTALIDYLRANELNSSFRFKDVGDYMKTLVGVDMPATAPKKLFDKIIRNLSLNTNEDLVFTGTGNTNAKRYSIAMVGTHEEADVKQIHQSRPRNTTGNVFRCLGVYPADLYATLGRTGVSLLHVLAKNEGEYFSHDGLIAKASVGPKGASALLSKFETIGNQQKMLINLAGSVAVRSKYLDGLHQDLSTNERKVMAILMGHQNGIPLLDLARAVVGRPVPLRSEEMLSAMHSVGSLAALYGAHISRTLVPTVHSTHPIPWVQLIGLDDLLQQESVAA